MELTTGVLAQFVGGQIEIQNPGEGYLYRGEIASAIVEGGKLRVTCAWLAQGEGYPPLPSRWINAPARVNRDYVASLEICRVGEIEPCHEEGERLIMQLSFVGEIIVFFTPDASRLDRSKVIGL